MAKVLVSLDDKLLRSVDRVARSRGLSRSAYIAALASSDLAREVGPGGDPAVRRTLSRLDRLFEDSPSGDSTDAIRSERDAR